MQVSETRGKSFRTDSDKSWVEACCYSVACELLLLAVSLRSFDCIMMSSEGVQTLEGRLLVRGFPSWLTASEKESLLSHFGASEVIVMPKTGKMVSCDLSFPCYSNTRIQTWVRLSHFPCHTTQGLDCLILMSIFPKVCHIIHPTTHISYSRLDSLISRLPPPPPQVCYKS